VNVTGYPSAIIIGIVVGVLGRLVLPGRQRLGNVATVLIGIGAALLGLFLSRHLHLDNREPAQLWRIHWHWITLTIQVGLAVVGIGLANMLTYTRLADIAQPARRRTTRRSRSNGRSNGRSDSRRRSDGRRNDGRGRSRRRSNA